MTDSPDGSERRRSPRLDLSVPLTLAVKETQQTLGGTTVNLSMTGLYALLDTPIRDFDTVEISLSLTVTMPEGEQESFTIIMPAVTVRVESTGDRIAAAFMFQGLPVETEWVIGKHILENFQQVR
jgi:hypothetical protein